MSKCPYCNNELIINGEPKTLKQMRYHYGVILDKIAEAKGYDREEIDQLDYELKRMFDPQTVASKLTGEEVDKVWLKRNSTKQRISEYLDWVIRFAAKEGIIIPIPDERNMEENN